MFVALVMAAAAVAVLATIVVVAVGRGGELLETHPDYPSSPLPFNRQVAGTDAALLRLPLGLCGYQRQITDEALERFAYALTERDTRIAVLETELAEARHLLGGRRPRQLQPAVPVTVADSPWPVPAPQERPDPDGWPEPDQERPAAWQPHEDLPEQVQPEEDRPERHEESRPADSEEPAPEPVTAEHEEPETERADQPPTAEHTDDELEAEQQDEPPHEPASGQETAHERGEQ